MISDNYRAYVNGNIKLVRSIIIKSTHTITAENSFLTTAGHQLSADPQDWRYYLNLNGEYYRQDYDNASDSSMFILSLDTQEEILFSKDTLVDHPITRFNYLNRIEYRRTLMARYPMQTALIIGILHPVPTSISIPAADFTILAYDKSEVESNEYSLLSKLQEWIYNYASRWDVRDYAITDVLYPAAMLSTMYLALVNKLINIRLSNCKTNEVHSYHLWNYLGSYFQLDDFKGRIPRAQALFLYKNISYITRHAGNSGTLDFLYTKFAKPFNLELFNFVLGQDSSNVLANYNAGHIDRLSNELLISKRRYGESTISNVNSEDIESSEFIGYYSDTAVNNIQHTENDLIELSELPLRTDNPETLTGLIECKLRRSAIAGNVNKTAIAIQNFFYMAVKGQYDAVINITVPSINIDDLVLLPEEAAALLIYCAFKYQGITTDTIPSVFSRNILVDQGLGYVELSGMAQSKNYKGSMAYGSNGNLEWDYITEILRDVPYVREISNITQMDDYLNSVIACMFRHELLLNLSDNAEAKGQLGSAIDRLYVNQDLELTNFTTFSELLDYLELDIANLEPIEYITLANTILIATTGITNVRGNLPSPQSDMVEILKRITSYTVSFTSTASNNANVEPIDLFFMDSNSKVSGIETTKDQLDFGVTVDIVGGNIIDLSADTEGLLLDSVTTKSGLHYAVDIGPGLNITNRTKLVNNTNIEVPGVQPYFSVTSQ